jgi:hypothetical protein
MTGSHRETTDVTEAVTDRWQEADEAVESLAGALAAQAAEAADRKRPHGRSHAKRHPKSARRQIAEVIRGRRLAPGLRVDRNMVAALFVGHRDLVSNPVLVSAVAQACGIIAGRKLSAKKVAQMRAASARVARLLAGAQAETRLPPARAAAPAPAPAPVLPVETVPVETVSVETVPVAPRAAVVVGRRHRSYLRRWWLVVVLVVLLAGALLVVGV